VVIST
jgi:hypothetical protein